MAEVRSFMGETQYLSKFNLKLVTVETPLHAINSKGNIFRWGKTQQITFEYLKNKIIDTPFLVVLNLQCSFELEIDASRYELRSVLMQG
jgi:hypothetical protein